MVEPATEEDFDADEWSFGEQQFASGELQRQVVELERLLAVEKRSAECTKEREQKKYEGQIKTLKERVESFKKKYQDLLKDRQTFFDQTRKQAQATEGDLQEANERIAEMMDELIEQDDAAAARKLCIAAYEKRIANKFTSLQVQAEEAEKRWLMVAIVLRFMIDEIGAGQDLHTMNLDRKALLIRCKDAFLYNAALPIWHAPIKGQLEGRKASDILAAYFGGDPNVLLRLEKPAKDEDEA